MISLSGVTVPRTIPSTGINCRVTPSEIRDSCSASIYEIVPSTRTGCADISISTELETPETATDRLSVENPSTTTSTFHEVPAGTNSDQSPPLSLLEV